MIELVNITRVMDDKVLFKDINLRIEKGSFVVVTGVSGAGKSTLLNIIGGLDYYHGGDVFINNKNTTNKSRQKYFDYLFQNFGLLESETIKYNLSLVKKSAREDYERLLDSVGLECELDQDVYTLSGGEQQRLALARLLLSNRDYILADEPTASLDVDNRDFVIEVLKKLNKKGKTIILVTHDHSLIKHLTVYYKVLVIDDGEIKTG